MPRATRHGCGERRPGSLSATADSTSVCRRRAWAALEQHRHLHDLARRADFDHLRVRGRKGGVRLLHQRQQVASRQVSYRVADRIRGLDPRVVPVRSQTAFVAFAEDPPRVCPAAANDFASGRRGVGECQFRVGGEVGLPEAPRARYATNGRAMPRRTSPGCRDCASTPAAPRTTSSASRSGAIPATRPLIYRESKCSSPPGHCPDESRCDRPRRDGPPPHNFAKASVIRSRRRA